jgi:hypothetical protein
MGHPALGRTWLDKNASELRKFDPCRIALALKTTSSEREIRMPGLSGMGAFEIGRRVELEAMLVGRNGKRSPAGRIP